MDTMTTDDAWQDGDVVPRQLGRYALGAKIGEGGMGVVYRARRDDGTEVAMKVLRPHIAHDPSARARLEREVHTLSRVHHPRVAAVLDADVTGDAPYIVTEYVPGAPLDTVVSENGPIRGEALVRLGRGLAEALSAIHQVGIVHRDLKPGNVLMVGRDPVVIDFGIAQVADDVRLTMTGMVMGTPGYLSPEVVEGGRVTEATDWWGWAATLAFANSGEPPFGRGPMSVVLDRVIRGRGQLGGVDPELQPLLAAALDTVPSRRPPAHEVIQALELYADHRPVTMALTRPVPPASESREDTPENPWAAGSASGAGAGGAAGMAGAAGASGAAGVADPTMVQPVDRTMVQPVAGTPATRQQPRPPQQGYPPAQGYPGQDPGAGQPGSYPPGQGAQPYPLTGAAGGQAGPTAYPQVPGQAQGAGDPRIGRPARSGTLAALLVAFVGLAAVVPLVAWGALAVWSVLARTTDQAVTSLVLRRHEIGRRKSDLPVAIISGPWHLALAAFFTVLALVLPLAVGIGATVVTAGGLTEFTSMSAGNEHPVPVAVGSLLGAVIAWWGPGGLSLRRGSRTVLRAVVPGGLATQVAAVFLVAGGLALLGWAVVEGLDVSWWPTADGQAPFRDLIPQVLRQ
ncbi:serine/threonine-protein kinase [Ornithinicoccus hortensis]|uniref:Serine/threonine protein kinase n=2 Tax=Ornithinicoccus hortensis TaxID=82346 RepID=A0A542YP73_9MICO|nr:serine/threonine protein kinase [Ornithinicoccus hortensis]